MSNTRSKGKHRYELPQFVPPRSAAALVWIATHAGLLLVDHIHFQYNGLLLGLLLLAVGLVQRRRLVAAAVVRRERTHDECNLACFFRKGNGNFCPIVVGIWVSFLPFHTMKRYSFGRFQQLWSAVRCVLDSVLRWTDTGTNCSRTRMLRDFLKCRWLRGYKVFAALLLLKHIFIYCAPIFFVYMFRHVTMSRRALALAVTIRVSRYRDSLQLCWLFNFGC